MPTTDENVKTTAAALAGTARAFAKSGDGPDWSALCQSAEEFAKARWAQKAPAAGPKPSGFVVPFGKSKGVSLAEASKKDLEWLASILPENIADPTKAKWSGKNQELLAAIEAELATR